MEFRFNLNEIFVSPISKINYTLLPSDFSGDKRKLMNCQFQVAEIIDAMGYASAKAQDLHHPITSADKLRDSDHTLYLMIDPDSNDGKGSVDGLLKIGEKNLFLFDEGGMIHEKKSMCILDFYIHESKQRIGLGKKLYDYMLKDKHMGPCKLAIDRPSENFISFLFKHYGQCKIYPQNNNFVLFEGFFSEDNETNSSLESLDHPATSEHVQKHIERHDVPGYDNHSIQSDEYKPTLYGRHTAFKPHDTMGKSLAWPPAATGKRSFKMTPDTPFW